MAEAPNLGDAAEGIMRAAQSALVTARNARPPTSREEHASWAAIEADVETIAGVLREALASGYTGHLHELARLYRKNRRSEAWLRACRVVRDGPPVITDRLWDLIAIDERAGTLTRQHVASARRTTRTLEGFAARLACDCGALDYANSRESYKNARDTFGHRLAKTK